MTNVELEKMQVGYVDAYLPADLIFTCNSLGVSYEAMRRLGTGWDGSAWTIPMKDSSGKIIGIHRRLKDGRKLCLKGSKLGLFIPDGVTGDRPLLVCEGATDTAAALTAGFDAVGLPSAGQGFDHAFEFIQSRGGYGNSYPHLASEVSVTTVVIVADLDEGTPLLNGEITWPGIEGALRLAERLMPIIDDLRFLLPPSGTKDLRRWLKTAGPEPIKDAVTSAPRVHAEWINRAWDNVGSRREACRLGWAQRAAMLLSTINDPLQRADLREVFEERAAIVEYDGNLPRTEAERLAYHALTRRIENVKACEGRTA